MKKAKKVYVECKRLKHRRQVMNMTRAELAEKSGVKECVIVAYEFGRRAVKLDNMVKLAQALKCKVDDIIEK